MKRAPSPRSRSFSPGTPDAEIRRFIERALGEVSAPRNVAAAAVGSAAATLSASDGDAGIEVTLEASGDEIRVRVSRAHGKDPRQPSFADWLTKTLERRGISQDAAARAIGVSLKTVNRWARGETEPRYRELGLIWDAFGERPPLPTAARRD